MIKLTNPIELSRCTTITQKQRRPRSDCSLVTSLIRVYTVTICVGIIYGRKRVTGGINSKAQAGCACSIVGMWVVCFLGGCYWSPDLRSIYSVSVFFFVFFLFLGDGLILDGYSQRTIKSKTTNLSNWPFRDINSKITKSSRILEYC